MFSRSAYNVFVPVEWCWVYIYIFQGCTTQFVSWIMGLPVPPVCLGTCSHVSTLCAPLMFRNASGHFMIFSPKTLTVFFFWCNTGRFTRRNGVIKTKSNDRNCKIMCQCSKMILAISFFVLFFFFFETFIGLYVLITVGFPCEKEWHLK